MKGKTMICRLRHVDHNFKEKKLSKDEFLVGETVKGDDAKYLEKIGVAVTEEKYDHIAKTKGTVPVRKVEKKAE